MSTKLSGEAFLAVVEKSGLVDAARLQKLLAEFDARGGNRSDPLALAEHLIAANALTRWQADKLLLGKHKGFLLGKYRLLSLLGRGGMSSVYLAEHMLMRRRCAIKVLPAKRVGDSSYLGRFHREAQAVAALDHPNIVRAYDVDQQNDRDVQIHFLVMEYVDGISLQDLVVRDGPLPFADAVDDIRQAANGFAYAHKAGLVHRDVKPGNLLRDTQGVIRILDLGLARFFDGTDDGQALTIKHDEKVLGTADYLAPEQAIDSHTVDARADIYSLGCTFYYLLTGHPPFNAGTLTQRLLAHQTQTPPPVEQERAELPPSLVEIVRKMMAKQASERYATMQEVADVLLKWLTVHADAAWKKAHADLFSAPAGPMAARVVAPLAKPVVATPVPKPPFPPSKSLSSTKLPAPASAVVPTDTTSVSEPKSTETPLPQMDLNLSGAAEPAGTSTTAIEPASEPELPATVMLPEAIATPSDTAFEFTGPFAEAAPTIDLTHRAPQPVKVPPAGRALRVRRRPSRWPLLAGAIVLVLGIGGAIGALSGWFPIARQAKTEVVEQSATLESEKAAKPSSDWDQKRETTVGPSGEFPTISAALEQLQRHFRAQNRSDRFLIKVAAGTYPDRITLLGKNWPERDFGTNVVIRGEGAVTLAPSGADPIVSLDNVKGVQLLNLTIQADGQPVAIALSNVLERCSLQKIVVQGFRDAGVELRGALGTSFTASRLQLEDVRFQPGDPAAVGARAVKGSDGIDCGNVVFKQCRFLGPLAAGVTIASPDAVAFEFHQCIFAETQFGIEWKGGASWRDFVIANNTFYKGQSAIRVEEQPGGNSKGLSIRRNLFVEQTGPEAIIEQKFDETALLEHHMLGAMRQNWSTRPATVPPTPGTLTVFSDEGRPGLTNIKFASTDPSAARFLAPDSDAPQRSWGGREKGEPNWIGAVGP